MMLCGLHPSEDLSVAWLETVPAELMKSSLVHLQYSAIAAICTLHGSLKVIYMYKLYCFNHTDTGEIIQ